VNDPPAPASTAQEAVTPRPTPELSARMLTYRLFPLWVFLFSLGLTMVWEFGVRGSPATADKLQAILLLAMLIALLIGAPIGIRWFNPLPPKK
jgi:hypothetical protein